MVSEPIIAEPVVTVFDGDGRMFVAEMRTSKGDGNFDKHTVFADGLMLPRMILPLGKGQIITNETDSQDIQLLTDRNGDGVADKKEIWFEGGPRGGNIDQPSGP